ncbi:unnamed protein product, partial [Heligmosomoides polygyrus]|uniref:RSN1_TM domain-containing protein n=1 Tax=Heligmosomoides polygyrus TaxID=6339 RepID=A0A183F2B8_HELPZ
FAVADKAVWISLRAPSLTTFKKIFPFESEQENFDEEFIRKAHNSDGINEDEWMLIYRDQGASRSFFLFAAIFPAFLVGLGVVGYDVCNNELSNRMGFVQRISRDVNEIGLLAIFPATSVVLVVLVLLRMHQLRLLRIYQNRKTVDDFVAVGSQNIVQKHKVLSGLLLQFRALIAASFCATIGPIEHFTRFTTGIRWMGS